MCNVFFRDIFYTLFLNYFSLFILISIERKISLHQLHVEIKVNKDANFMKTFFTFTYIIYNKNN